MAGTLADGPLGGARVFLDINGNLSHDEDEPIASPTGPDGAFSLATGRLTAAQVASSLLVAHVPATAFDADDGGLDLRAAGRKGFTLLSPAVAYLRGTGAQSAAASAMVSPLTTLVAAEMAFNGRNLAAAKAAVQQQLALGARDPMTNFVTRADAALGQKARVVAVSLGEYGRSIAAAAQAGEGQAARDRVAGTVEAARTALPGVLAAIDTSGVSPGPIPVVTITAQLPPQTALVNSLATRERQAPARRKFVVVFKETVANPAQAASEAMRGRSGEVGFTYTTAIKGFSVSIPEPAADAFVTAMQNNPNVDRVEPDITFTVAQTTQQAGATWGLDRSDQRDLPLNGSYSYATTGAGVRAYIIDTGVLAGHTDFGGRVAVGYTAIADGRGTTDCNGHGTHVAGTVGSATWGVAKGVGLVPVRVLGCDGTGPLSGVIAGLDWVAAQGALPALVNLSLGGGTSTTLDAAVARVVGRGVTVVVAAGNDNVDACTASPAREPSAITVGATTSIDARASYSNFGACLDLFAPGSSIRSTWYTSTTATQTISGTSMASPHVAGLAALMLQATPAATAAEVANGVKAAATAGKVSGAGTGSPNLLIYSNAMASGGGSVVTPTPTPTAVGVSQLVGDAISLRNGWRANVTITVRDSAGNVVPGAAVTGSFSVGGTQLVCTTASNGMCSVRSGNVSKKAASTAYTVGNITGNGLTYTARLNAMTSVVINRP